MVPMILQIENPINGSEIIVKIFSDETLTDEDKEKLQEFFNKEFSDIPVDKSDSFIIVVSEIHDEFHCFSAIWINKQNTSFSGGILTNKLPSVIRSAVSVVLNVVHQRMETGHKINVGVSDMNFIAPFGSATPMDIDEVTNPKNWEGPGKHK